MLAAASVAVLGLLASAGAQDDATGAAVAPTATASTWTVQVVALRDLREAQDVAEQLRGFGFEAYTAFTMANGQQWVRVRVGCATTRGAAARLAGALKGGWTADAVPVRREASDAPVPCVERTVGFLKPAAWTSTSRGLFDVVVAGRNGRIGHDGAGWYVLQPQDTAAPEPLPPAAGFRTETMAGRSVVRAPSSLGGGVVCAGRLVADLGSVAIVEERDAVVACRYVDLSLADAGASAP